MAQMSVGEAIVTVIDRSYRHYFEKYGIKDIWLIKRESMLSLEFEEPIYRFQIYSDRGGFDIFGYVTFSPKADDNPHDVQNKVLSEIASFVYKQHKIMKSCLL